MDELRRDFKAVELVAVNQCSGNSRAFFTPRVTGGQLGVFDAKCVVSQPLALRAVETYFDSGVRDSDLTWSADQE